jgi:hypothetical protein
MCRLVLFETKKELEVEEVAEVAPKWVEEVVLNLMKT